MKTFVLFVLTLCVAHCEMSRQLFPERGQRHKSKLDQGSHHGLFRRSIWQFLRKNIGHQKAISESRSHNRVARSVIIMEHISKHEDNGADTHVSFGSGSSSGQGSGSLSMWPNDGIQADQTQTSKESQTLTGSAARVPAHETKRKSESSNSNVGVVSVLKPTNRRSNRTTVRIMAGSGDAGSGSSSDRINVIDSGVHESSGSDQIEEVVINSNVAQPQFAQGHGETQGHSESQGSGTITCVGDISCNQGSGSVEISEVQIVAAEDIPNSSVQRDSVPGKQVNNGVNVVGHQP